MKDSKNIIIKGLVSESPTSLLLDEYEKTNSTHTRSLIEEELTCPECSNDLFFDNTKNDFYCPKGCKL